MSSFEYDLFLSKLNLPDAAMLIDQLKAFISSFNQDSRLSTHQQKQKVTEFLDQIAQKSKENPAFAEILTPSDDDSSICSVREGWEKLVMLKIFDQVFGAPGSDEFKFSSILADKISRFKFVRERHLELPFQVDHNIEYVQAELLKVNGFRSPRDKLTVLSNVIKLALDLIRSCSGVENPSNDHLLPVLILVVLQTDPPNLISNIKYIMRFRNPQELDKGSNQFCLTTMMGAVSFIYNLTPSSLKLNDEDMAQFGEAFQTLAPVAPLSQQSFSPEMPNLLKKNESGNEFRRIASTISDFFGNMVKEAKSTANELISLPDASSPPSVFRLPSHETAPRLPARDAQQRENDRAQMEEYEMQLAMALSLSLKEEEDQRMRLNEIDSGAVVSSASNAASQSNDTSLI